MSAPLRIHSDRRYLPAGQLPVVMLYPFWGKPAEDPRDPDRGRFDAYCREGTRFFALEPLDDCELAVLPGYWRKGDPLAEEFIGRAAAAGKPVVLFFTYDSTEEIPVKDGFIFRTSFYATDRQPNEFAEPAWSEDFLERYEQGELPIRPWQPRPVVSYCGYSMDWKARVRAIAGRPVHAGQALRSRAIARLKKSPAITTQLRIRRGFWAGVHQSREGGVDYDRVRRVRREYAENMIAGDYVLCSRGGGNFSYRLYEALSLGRIPILINTDCVLPYERWIDWNQAVVWVEERDLDTIASRVLQYHERLRPEAFVARQRANRALWEEWLSPQGFFKNLHRIVRPNP